MEYWHTNNKLYDRGNQYSEFHHREWEFDGIEMNRFAARWYDPTIARWHATDPLEQMHSPYVALCNDPANYVDPDGRAGIHLSDWDKQNLIGFAAVLASGAAFVGIGQALQGVSAAGKVLSGISQAYNAIKGPLSIASTIFSGATLVKNITEKNDAFGAGSAVSAAWQDDLMGEIRSHSGVGLAFRGAGNKNSFDGQAANKDSNSKKLGDNPSTKEEEPNEKILFRIDTYGLVRWIKEKIFNDPAASETFHHGFKIVSEKMDKYYSVYETLYEWEGTGAGGNQLYTWNGKGVLHYQANDENDWSESAVNGINIEVLVDGRREVISSAGNSRASGKDYTPEENALVNGGMLEPKTGKFEISVQPTSLNVKFHVWIEGQVSKRRTVRRIRFKKLNN